MYKTVRKGDASLQYTILPQTDQFASTGFSQSSSKPRPKIIKYTMGTLMILIIMSCVATPFLMNQNDHNLFASTVLAMRRVEHGIFKNSTKSSPKDASIDKEKIKIGSSAKPVIDVEREKGKQAVSTTEPNVLDDNEQKTTGMTTGGSPFVSYRPTQNTLMSTTSVDQTSSTSAASSSATTAMTTTTTTTTTTTLKPSTTLETTKSSLSIPRKLPRVTLKLRENETIPQMYMKAGIASYKKGNITTSVLAHGLSLEGLIFKTPEGTIKPWPQKWPFTDPSSYFQWKGVNQMPVAIYIVLAGLAALASMSIVLMFYVQRKASRRQRQSVEEPEAGCHEEDKSTLLGAEVQETEEKE